VEQSGSLFAPSNLLAVVLTIIGLLSHHLFSSLMSLLLTMASVAAVSTVVGPSLVRGRPRMSPTLLDLVIWVSLPMFWASLLVGWPAGLASFGDSLFVVLVLNGFDCFSY
jgi:hypothetical protein